MDLLEGMFTRPFIYIYTFIYINIAVHFTPSI